TNVISITDGQIFLLADLFYKGIRPAVDVGKSVSRVGGAAQIKGMKQVAGSLKLELAQFRELEAFAAFASDLDAITQAQLARGRRLVEILKQGQYQPVRVENQISIIFAATNGYLDKISDKDVVRFEKEFTEFMEQKNKKILQKIAEEKAVKDDTKAQLKDALTEFLAIFKTAGEA
ncbi:MAG: F0F1 ATP synthase subunit alpha, partial [Bdellovibrionota bacterium]